MKNRSGDGKTAQDYYRELTAVDIGEVARELLDHRIRSDTPTLLRCDCPHHESGSHESLHVMVDKQGFYCFGCRVGGDVLQLVEFVQSGQVTSGQWGPMPETHRKARDFLAARVGLPPLTDIGLSAERLAEAEAKRREGLRVQETLTAVAKIYHERLRQAPEALEWLKTNYAISDETIERLLIGYSDSGDGEVLRRLRAEPHGIKLRDLAATGTFLRKPQGGLRPFFHNRIIFPYWSGGRVVYMIGRKTPWTPDDGSETPKYKKLPGRSESRPYISATLRNDHLFNEDCLITRPDHVIVTEGVTDCIGLMERGFPTVSPATVRIKRDDWERIFGRLHGVKTIYVCMDNELSGVGLSAAVETASAFADHEIEAKVVVLPLGEPQRVARESIERTREQHPGEELDPALVAQAKLDVNGYFLGGATADDFRALLAEARTPLELAIESLPTTGGEASRNQALGPILSVVARLSPVEVDRHLRLIRERGGEPRLSMGSLRDQVKVLRKEARGQAIAEEKQRNQAPPGSCRAAIDQAAMESAADPARMAEAAFQWFCDNGGRFFRTRHGEPFVFFQNQLSWMDTSDRGRRRLYYAQMYEQTGIVATTTTGKSFYEVLANLAAQHGEIRENFSWLHSDVTGRCVYVNLNNPAHEIAKITPKGVEIVPNGGNEDGIILEDSEKLAPIHFEPDATIAEADRLFAELVTENLLCSAADRELIGLWLSCFPLIDFAGTRPMLRFEGSSDSGKTVGSKLITALVYGTPQQKKSTDAANYTDGARNPLVALDNIEAKNVTDDLSTFILTCVTGIAREKRKAGTDTETVAERTKCLLNTNGIEPLGGAYWEIISRSLVVKFDAAEGRSGCFLESQVLARIQENRDHVLSGLLKKVSQILGLMRDDAQAKVMGLLQAQMPGHGKQRCNDFLALMYLVSLAGKPEAEVEAGLATLDPGFVAAVSRLNEIGHETARESNPIADALNTLFAAHARAVEEDERPGRRDDHRSPLDVFRERYLIEFAGVDRLEGVLARDLRRALARAAADFRQDFPYATTQQFVQRFINDLDSIRRAGFVVETEKGAHNFNLYSIRRAPDDLPF